MTRITSWLVAGTACFLMGSCLAATTEVSGVKLNHPIELDGSRLILNGAGVRHRAVFPVYVAALFMTQKATTPEDVFATPGPKRISITMLRSIDAAELGKIFTRSVEDNSPKKDMFRLIPDLLRMSKMFTEYKNLDKDDNFTIDWIPGTGTIITVKGRAQGEPFKEPEFFNALLRIWIGPNPADWKLKDAMLNAPTK